jgi:peptide/nickel transport system substrate-binding protein
MRRRKRYRLTVILAVLALVVAACTDDDDVTSSATTSSAPSATTSSSAPSATTSSSAPSATTSSSAPSAEALDELVVAVGGLGATESLDPVTSIQDDKSYLRLLYMPLFGTDINDREVCPCDGLAREWSFSDEGKTLSIELREGVQFHNGDEVTADDVKFSLDRLFGPDVTSVIGSFLEDISSIDVTGTYSLDIHLAQPSVTLETFLSPLGSTMAFIMPKAYIEEVGVQGFRDAPIGSGPYRFVDRQAGSHMEFEAFDGYFLGKPTVNRIRLEVIPEESTRHAMLEAGEANVIEISTERAGEFEDAGFNVFSQTGATVNVLFFAAHHPELKTDGKNPLEDVRVREALTVAIDVEEIIEQLLGGLAKTTGTFAYDGVGIDARPGHTTDLARAEELLREAGYDQGFDLTFYIALKPGSPEFVIIGETIAATWEQLGVTASILPIEWGSLRPRVVEKSVDVPSVRLHSLGTRPFYDGLFGIITCDGGTSLMCDPQLDAIVDGARAAEIVDDYVAAIDAASNYSRENYLAPVLFVSGPIFATTGEVTDWQLGGSAYSRNYRYLFLTSRDLN